MEENYTELGKIELINILKSRDEQITEILKKYDCIKSELTKESEKSKFEMV